MIAKSVTNCNNITIKIMTVIAIVVTTVMILDISTLQEMKAQSVFLGSQQLTKIPAPGNQLLPQQKNSESVCDPNDRFVNTSESKNCGVPPTVTANNAGASPISPGPSILQSSR